MNAASHSKNLIDIIDSGCELEDISSIIPKIYQVILIN
ncbi:hypothetical protein ACLB1T_18445 [Escherichia coli]